MLSHLFRSGVRALGVAIVLGTLMIYASGGLSSPQVTPLVGLSIAAFFVFWVAFACFARRSYTRDRLRDDVRHGDGWTISSATGKWIRGDKRTDDELGERGEIGEGGGDD